MAEQNEPSETVRVNVYITKREAEMLDEIGSKRYPGRKKVDGLIIGEAIRVLYERVKEEQR